LCLFQCVNVYDASIIIYRNSIVVFIEVFGGQMKRQFTNILTDNVNQLAAFYGAVFGMQRYFDSDWFIILTHLEIPASEFGLLERTNAIVPDECR
jgi:hypothetical protein